MHSNRIASYALAMLAIFTAPLICSAQSIITTVAGNGGFGSTGDGGLATSASIGFPNGVAVDDSGNIYIADALNSRIRKVNAAGVISTFAGNGFPLFAGDGGPAASASISLCGTAPHSGIAADHQGNVYIADCRNNRIRKVNSAGIISTVAGIGGTTALSGDGGPATSANLGLPYGVSVDAAGNLYIADTGNGRIRKVDVTTGIITTVAGTTNGFNLGDGGSALNAQLANPHDVVLDSIGNMYIADFGNGRIRRVNAGGVITSVLTGGFGNCQVGPGVPAASADIGFGVGLAVDAANNLYISDASANCVHKMSTQGLVTTVAGGGINIPGDGGPPTSAGLGNVTDVEIDSQGNLYLSDKNESRVRKVNGGTGSGCNYSLTTTSIQATSAGGTFNVGITTTSPCAWTVAGLPFWITLSGASSGTGSASVSLVVASTVAARSGTITIAGISVTVNQSGPVGCLYVFSSGGQAFPAAGGSASLTITTAPGCQWSAVGAPSWIIFTNSSSGSGNGTINYQAVANPGAFRSGSMTIAGTTFNLEQASGSVSGLAPAGSLAQIAFNGGWTTSFTFVNTGSASAQIRTNFSDNSGNPLLLPLTFPQSATSSGALLASTLDRTLSPGASLIMAATGSDTQAQVVGSGQLLTTGNVGSFGIFSFPFFKWNAVVPLEIRSASSYLLAFDNTGVLATGVAVANLTLQSNTFNMVIRDDTGAVLTTAAVTVPAQSHDSYLLKDRFPITNLKRGTVQFNTSAGGQISILGLRANGGALTTLPVLSNLDSSGGSITHATYNGGFTTFFTLVNTGSTAASATLSFFDNNGVPLSAPLSLPQTATTVTTSALTRTIAPGASLLIQTQAQDSLPPVVGSAQLTTTGAVSGFAIFNWTTFGQEASVPLETHNASGYLFAFDDTNGLTTGLALANVSGPAANITVIIRDDTGAMLQTTAINLAAQGHTSFMLPDNYAVTVGKRGTVEFVTPPGGRISVVGLRAKSDGTLTTIPVLTK